MSTLSMESLVKVKKRGYKYKILLSLVKKQNMTKLDIKTKD